MILVYLVLQVAIVVIRCDGALSPSERYWKAVLPNSPMPQAVKVLLPTPTGVGVDAANGRIERHAAGRTIYAAAANGKIERHAAAYTIYAAAANGRIVRHAAPIILIYAAATNGRIERANVTGTQLHDDPTASLFFLEKDMHAGTKMKLQFVKTSNQATFLPRQVADSIPFSSKRFPEILRKFKPTSDEADIMKDTIKDCEDEGIKGEEKFCATSLESMIDFCTSKLGSRNVEAISTNAQENAENSSPKEYTLVGAPRKMPGNKAVVACHKMDYAYAVFYCHKIAKTVAYEVSLAAADGCKVEAVAVCHHDTSQWNPKHFAFQVLKVQPGSVPVCHFLPQQQIVWVPKY
uniref:BURP-domain containing protein n=1 Tax=Plantago major TaxID=29818 RepID=Q5ZFA0_PLAMJ|nr:BURP-domain containing protein [Plantago major]